MFFHLLNRTPADPPEEDNEREVNFVDYKGEKFSSLRIQFREKNNSSIAPGGGGGAGAGVAAPHSRGKNSAVSACAYLREHDVSGMMRKLVSELLVARPQAPMEWLAKNMSRFGKLAGHLRPEGEGERLGPGEGVFGGTFGAYGNNMG